MTYGLGESAIASRIVDWENNLPQDIKLAYLPNLGRVRLRLSGKGNDESILEQRIDSELEKLLPLIKDIFVGFEDSSSFEEKIQLQFLEKNQTLSIAESCTGGEIAARLTKIPGASGYFKGGLVVYHTQSKSDLLGVPEEVIQKHSVVSQAVAEAMAIQVRQKFNSNIGLATTGNAGPSKGDSKAEVGTVWISIATDNEVFSEQFLFGKHRKRVVGKAVNKALEMVFKHLI
jgi:nicotinamide-nucleotide amidase